MRISRKLAYSIVGYALRASSTAVMLSSGLLERLRDCSVTGYCTGLELIGFLAPVIGLYAIGFRLSGEAWSALRAYWSRRAKLVLLVFSTMSASLWLISFLLTSYIVTTRMITTRVPLVGVSNSNMSVKLAFASFVLASSLGAVSAIIHVTQAKSYVGRVAASLLFAGAALYALNSIILYTVWLDLRLELEACIGSISGESCNAVNMFVGLIGRLKCYLTLHMISQLLLSIGFCFALLDYLRCSKGT